VSTLAHLLRPPSHRVPLIASGAVLLAVGVAMQQLRMEEAWGDGVHLVVAGASAGLLLWLGAQASLESAAPRASQSVLLVTGLLLLAVALFRLADVLGAGDDGYPSGAVVWTSLVLCGAALFPAVRRNSAICAFIAAVAGVVAVLHAWDWIFHPGSLTPYRWLLLLGSLGFVVLSLALRGGRYRHSVLMVDVAGLMMAALGLSLLELPLIAVVGIGEAGTGTGWELMLLAAGCGLVAYGAVDRQPGPAFLGVFVLGLFVALAVPTGDGDATLLYWPLLLLLLGAGVMAAGLRPRRPLPPQPAGYKPGDMPLAATSTDEETIIRVRHET